MANYHPNQPMTYHRFGDMIADWLKEQSDADIAYILYGFWDACVLLAPANTFKIEDLRSRLEAFILSYWSDLMKAPVLMNDAQQCLDYDEAVLWYELDRAERLKLSPSSNEEKPQGWYICLLDLTDERFINMEEKKEYDEWLKKRVKTHNRIQQKKLRS